MSTEEKMHVEMIERDFMARKDMAHLGINWSLIETPSHWTDWNWWYGEKLWPSSSGIIEPTLRQMKRTF